MTIALRTGAALPDGLRERAFTRTPVTDATQLARGLTARLDADLPVRSYDCTPGDASTLQIIALTAAVAGDGGLLAELIDRCGIQSGRGMRNMFGLWRWIERDRERLAAQLAVAMPDVTARDDLFDVLRRALLRRDLARLTGDAAGTAAWQGLIDRHLAVLGDRDVAIALVMWHLL